MSHEVNTTLFERAYELREELASHPSGIDRAIGKAIEDNDLKQLRYLVNKAEAELSEEHFHNYDII